MKKTLKVIASICAVLMLLTCFATVSFAKEEYEWSRVPAGAVEPDVTNYTWEALGEAVKVEQTGKYFVITTKAGEHTEKLYVSLPAEGGFRMQSQHEYENGIQESHVGLFEPSSIATIEYKTDSAGAVIMKGSDGTTLRFKKYSGGFTFDICNENGTKLLGFSNKQISFAYDNRKGTVVRMLVEFPLTNGEGIYQGGERYNTTNQVGAYTSLNNVDAWSVPDFAYINVPIFHSNRGYSVWFNNSFPGDADMGWSNENKYSLLFDGSRLDFFLWTGTPLENLKKYTDLTGTSGMYNEWTFGFWTGAMSSAFDGTRKMNAYENMIDLLEGYAENYNFYPESMYGEGKNSQYALNINYQKERGIRTTFWFSPQSALSTMRDYLPGMKQYPQFDEDGNMISTGYPYNYVTLPLQQGQYIFQQSQWYDYSNPSTIDVTIARMYQLWQWGVSGAMIDYGEYVTHYGTAFNGMSSQEMHNFNSYYYAKHSAEAWDSFWKGDYVLYERSGCAGSQYFVGNFLGDQRATWVGYKGQITSMISLGASGYNLYGGDLCSLGGKVTNDLMSRWIVLSCFSPWNRQHGSNIHMPWEQGEANKQNFGQYYYFRKNIVPTVMSAAMDANKTSNPIVKGMMMAYPYQLKLVDIDNQYLFCDDFLVCAVDTEDQYMLDVTLPNGDTWYNLFTYEKLRGGQKLFVEAPTAFMPVYVKDGAVKAINLPESMILADEMHDDVDVDSILGEEMGYGDEHRPHASLLITPPDEERTSTIHVMDGDVEDFRTYESHTEVYTSKPVDDTTFTITNEEGSDRTTVLALGVTASEIYVDGELMTRHDHMPDYYYEEYGYYVERAGLTTIYVPAGWKELKIVKGDADYTPYEMYGSEVGAVDRIFDEDLKSTYQLPTLADRPTVVAFNSDEAVPVGRVVIKWALGYLETYDIEYSEDGGETWALLTEYEEDENTVVNGAGSFDVLTFSAEEAVNATHLRITPVEVWSGKAAPSIYTMEVYAPDTFEPIPVTDEEDEEYDEEDFDDVMDGLGDDEDEDESTGKKKKKKYIVTSGIPAWLLILIIAGGSVLILTAALIIILLVLKKKKKQAAEAAAAAEGASEDVPPPAAE